MLNACGGSDKKKQKSGKTIEKPRTYQDTLEMQKDSLHIDSEYDLETVDRKHQKEFMESLSRIEDEFGEQWDFCTCIVTNDSINKASMKDLPDAEFDKLIERMDYVDTKCKAFLVQSLSQTPEERYEHEAKVKDCLKAAGIK
jgi:hypothetical protein